MSQDREEDAPPAKADGSQPTPQQSRKALAYLLLGLGLPIAAAFLYPFLPGRRRTGSLWSHMDGSPRALAVLVIGAAVGVCLAVAGYVLLQSGGAEKRRRW